MAENIILCSYLGICSCYDCKDRRIPFWLLSTGIGLGLAYAGVMLLAGKLDWQSALAGMAPGGVMLLYSRLSLGKLGWADGLMVIASGLLIKWESCMAAVLLASFLTFWLAVVLLLSGRGNRNTRIPFAPFLLAGTAIVWIMRSVQGDICV